MMVNVMATVTASEEDPISFYPLLLLQNHLLVQSSHSLEESQDIQTLYPAGPRDSALGGLAQPEEMLR